LTDSPDNFFLQNDFLSLIENFSFHLTFFFHNIYPLKEKAGRNLFVFDAARVQRSEERIMKIKDKIIFAALFILSLAVYPDKSGITGNKIAVMNRLFFESVEKLPFDPGWVGMWSGIIALDEPDARHVTLSIRKRGETALKVENEIFSRKNLPLRWKISDDTLLGEAVIPLKAQSLACAPGEKGWAIFRVFLKIRGDRLEGWFTEKEGCYPSSWTSKDVALVHVENQLPLFFDRMP
jgi:hypothetical protein